ncbi:MAG TPA: TlpA disulfide reductase family protein [Cyclobacteriaceae bacterium]|jgi:thiol-disulfide isomerase/thioredoxin|nr:TlpA disulfide reductase family protein [Cyclobacteriaceae bacterium]
MTRILALFLLVTTSALAQQEISIVKFNTVQKLLDDKSAPIQIINFWATWCAPCVKELPLIEAINEQSAEEEVKVTLISLDFADKIDKVKSFVKLKKIKSTVVLLDDIDYNSWIDKIDKEWSGAIPATLLLNTKTGKRKFIEKELVDGELQTLIKEIKE